MRIQKAILIWLAGSLVLPLILLTGCTERSLKGDSKSLTAPSVFWADVQMDTIFHMSATLRWYSTDQDGMVLDYQYAVLIDTAIYRLANASDSASRENAPGVVASMLSNEPLLATWTIVHKDSATVPLYASTDTGAFVRQWIYLRAMDDDSLYSDVIYKFLTRNNHPPTCYLVLPTAFTGTSPHPDPQWCLPETTSTWRGVRLAWVGKDSIDYPGLAPEFEWNVRVYGPFADSASSAAFQAIVDTTDAVTENLYQQLYNPGAGTESTWVNVREYYFTNLVTGWYVIWAQNRDDASVPSHPATGFLVIYEPTWIRHPEQTKPILIASHEYFPYAPFWGELDSSYQDDVTAFYEGLLDSAGYGPGSYDYVQYTTVPLGEIEPRKSDLYTHRLVIALDTDWNRPFTEDPAAGKLQETAYKKYLDVGGMLWIIGRRSFEGANISPGLMEVPSSGPHSIAFSHFNLSSIWVFPINFRQAEFAGAVSLLGGFPDLFVDTLRVAQTSRSPYFYSHGLFGVDYLIRFNDSETIYQFKSINPDTSRADGFPVAVRYDKGTFKTSYYSFPLYFIQTHEAVEVTRVMLEWFFPNG